jgi:hypothetical protein
LNQPLLGGSVPWTQRLLAGVFWLIGLAMAGALLVFGFFVGAALLGIAAVAGLIAWARLRWGKPIFPGAAGSGAPPRPRQRSGETIIDAEYVVIKREQRQP